MNDQKRTSGILFHITSLPGEFGIGTFGKSAKNFVDFLSQCGFSWWQILPLSPIDNYNSPYKSLSAFGGNIYLIDPQTLYDLKLVTNSDLDSQKIASDYQVDYEFIKENRKAFFKIAYNNRTPDIIKSMEDFSKAQSSWLLDYALYNAIKETQNLNNWTQWQNKDLKNRKPSALKKAILELQDAIDFEIFLQYLFHTQWQDLKVYANEKGIGFIGDMPIYLDLDSPDVWCNQSYFQLDVDGNPKVVSGVPPDYFSADGQLWGNPLYNWNTLKKDNYRWWIQRIQHNLDLYNCVRIDHFRAFSAYWSVDSKATTAKDGQWCDGPKMDLFNQVKKSLHLDTPPIIAENLGTLDQGVYDLLEATKFKGMSVLQFAFIDNMDNPHLPHNYSNNTMAYTSTHDNNTLYGWLWELTPDQRAYALDYVGYPQEGESWKEGGYKSPSVHAFIRQLFVSSAITTMVTIQDLCGYGKDTRMNTPGEAKGNWGFRIPQSAIDQIDIDWIKHLNALSKR